MVFSQPVRHDEAEVPDALLFWDRLVALIRTIQKRSASRCQWMSGRQRGRQIGGGQATGLGHDGEGVQVALGQPPGMAPEESPILPFKEREQPRKGFWRNLHRQIGMFPKLAIGMNFGKPRRQAESGDACRHGEDSAMQACPAEHFRTGDNASEIPNMT